MQGNLRVAVVDSEFVRGFLLPKLVRAGIQFDVVLRGLPRRGKPLNTSTLLIDLTKRKLPLNSHIPPTNLLILLVHRNTTNRTDIYPSKQRVVIKLPTSLQKLTNTIKQYVSKTQRTSSKPPYSVIARYVMNNARYTLEEYTPSNSSGRLYYRLVYNSKDKTAYIPLTLTQMLILKELLDNYVLAPFSFVSQQKLVTGKTIKASSLPVIISKLRYKLAFFKIPLLIQNFYGQGYIIKSTI